uniref:UPF0102 protein MAGMO_3903 n=1 Tax=Magnetococcus massalia (strain MO-1) TaxID=451514 RepID=A0A1S7LQF9_MAGMO|nr:Putative endonuclease distantly related to archaeal Holliday junction resolvase [Candidatus Magnetococcus massalia]
MMGLAKLSRKLLGDQGERAAAQRMRQQGYKILHRNVRTRYGEIDLIAQQGETLIFCEVKARRGATSGHPAEAIDPRKQAKLIQLAQAWLQQHPQWSEAPCRFDAALVYEEHKQWQVTIIQDAFRPGW